MKASVHPRNEISRYRAALIHLSVSAIVGASLAALCWFVWYPKPMLTAVGGHEIFMLILGIDVVLGPLLTLVVFKSGKRTLKFDLAVIAALQIAALVYGLHTLLQARPVYLASNGSEFQVVLATEITEANLKKANASLPWFGPKLVGTIEPTDKHDKDELEFVTEMGGGRGHFPKLHASYESTATSVLQKSLPIQQLIEKNKSRASEIDSWLRARGHTVTSAVYQPLRIRASEFAMILDRNDGSIVGIGEFTP
jgi:hypothetical protein